MILRQAKELRIGGKIRFKPITHSVEIECTVTRVDYRPALDYIVRVEYKKPSQNLEVINLLFSDLVEIVL